MQCLSLQPQCKHYLLFCSASSCWYLAKNKTKQNKTTQTNKKTTTHTHTQTAFHAWFFLSAVLHSGMHQCQLLHFTSCSCRRCAVLHRKLTSQAHCEAERRNQPWTLACYIAYILKLEFWILYFNFLHRGESSSWFLILSTDWTELQICALMYLQYFANPNTNTRGPVDTASTGACPLSGLHQRSCAHRLLTLFGYGSFGLGLSPKRWDTITAGGLWAAPAYTH